MSDNARTWLAVGAVCATIAGSTWFQSQRIDDLRTDVQREISDLRDDVREIRGLLISHLTEHPAND